MSDGFSQSQAFMGTVVSIEIVGHGSSQRTRRARRIAIDHAMQWFQRVEDTCSRFDANSELRQLSTRVGEPVVVSPMLFEVVRFALGVANETNGVFDPTVGLAMEARGFDRAYQDGAKVSSTIVAPPDITFRDVTLHASSRSITLHRPLLLDLGAVAKGLAVDMAAKTLAPFEDFVVDAGGDLYAGGVNGQGTPWEIGLRDPFDTTICFETMRVSNAAVCTSGTYEQRSPTAEGMSHLIAANQGRSPDDVASVSVLAPSAMVADALATAAFLLGSNAGLAFLDTHDVDGVLLTTSGERLTTTRSVRV